MRPKLTCVVLLLVIMLPGSFLGLQNTALADTPSIDLYLRGSEAMYFAPAEPGYETAVLVAYVSHKDETWIDTVLAAVEAQHPGTLTLCDDGVAPWSALLRVDLEDDGRLFAQVATGASCDDETFFSPRGRTDDELRVTPCTSADDGHEGRLTCDSAATDAEVVDAFRLRYSYTVHTRACTDDGVCPFSLDAGETTIGGVSNHKAVERFEIDCAAAPDVCNRELTVFGVLMLPKHAKPWCAEDPTRCP